MEFTLKENETTLTVVFNGELDSISSPDVEEELFPLMEEKAFETVIFDCTDLSYIASSGLRILFTILQKGCRVVIKNANEMLRSVLDSTGLASVFEFV